ncbi:MAG: hypothetical protein QOJ89_4745 [bacterium]|jgi:hypothetical protein
MRSEWSLAGSHRLGLAAIAMLGSLAALVLAAAPAAAAEKAIWGPLTLPGGGSALALYDELGVDTLQLRLSWADVAPERPAVATDPDDGAYRWPAELAAAEAEAAGRAINLALLVFGTPPWANGSRSPLWAPQRPQDYADFLTAAARRYPSVHRWMIWGEPNRSDRFRPNRVDSAIGPRAYAPLLDAAYVALKRESPSNRVIGGMTWTGGTVKPASFLRMMRLANGRRPRLDWYGHNPFPFRFPTLSEPPIEGSGFRDISDSDTFSREIAGVYGRRVPLWLSEFTIQSDHGSSTFATFVSQAAQARYVTAAWKLADDLGGAVAGIGWLSLLDDPPSKTSANTGLLTHALQRKPAFAAFARAPAERLRPAVQTAASTSRATLRSGGLAVRVTARAGGVVVVELRRGGRVLASARTSAASGSIKTLRLRSSARAGRYVVAVRAARGSTVTRPLLVR